MKDKKQNTTDLHGTEITTLLTRAGTCSCSNGACTPLSRSPLLSFLSTSWLPLVLILTMSIQKTGASHNGCFNPLYIKTNQYFVSDFVILHLLCHLFRIFWKGNLIGSGYLFNTGLNILGINICKPWFLLGQLYSLSSNQLWLEAWSHVAFKTWLLPFGRCVGGGASMRKYSCSGRH